MTYFAQQIQDDKVSLESLNNFLSDGIFLSYYTIYFQVKPIFVKFYRIIWIGEAPQRLKLVHVGLLCIESDT